MEPEENEVTAHDLALADKQARAQVLSEAVQQADRYLDELLEERSNMSKMATPDQATRRIKVLGLRRHTAAIALQRQLLRGRSEELAAAREAFLEVRMPSSKWSGLCCHAPIEFSAQSRTEDASRSRASD